MSETTTITVQLDSVLKDKLDALAESTQRSQDLLAAEAIANYLEQEAWQVQQIEAALQQAEQPNATWVPHAEVSAWLTTWGTDAESEAPCP